MTPLVVLVPSPLLGPAVWGPVAAGLAARGWDTTVLDLRASPVDTADEVLQAMVAALPVERDVVLVPHSNAGLYASALDGQRRLRGVVFVDAGLPAARGPTPVAPPALVDLLAQKADADAVLPPWTAWWDEADVAPLFPDAQVRALVEAEQRRLPLAYFRSSVPAAAPIDDLPWAYLAFGETYEQEAARAAASGRRLVRLSGGHLHMLTAPEDVAAALASLLEHVVGDDR